MIFYQSWLWDGIFSGAPFPNPDPGDLRLGFLIFGYIEKSRLSGNLGDREWDLKIPKKSRKSRNPRDRDLFWKFEIP